VATKTTEMTGKAYSEFSTMSQAFNIHSNQNFGAQAKSPLIISLSKYRSLEIIDS